MCILLVTQTLGAFLRSPLVLNVFVEFYCAYSNPLCYSFLLKVTMFMEMGCCTNVGTPLIIKKDAIKNIIMAGYGATCLYR